MSKTEAAKIMERFEQAKRKRQHKDPKWTELDAFDRNEQWDLKAAPPWLPKPVTNFVHLVKYMKRAALAMENPTGKLRAVSSAGIDRVDKLNKAFQHTFARIKARMTVRECVETSRLLGTGIAHVWWDEYAEGQMGSTVQGDEGFQYEGEIRTRQIDPACFFPDPKAFTIDECDYIIIRERKSREWVEQHPKFKSKFGKNETPDVNDVSQDRGEIYLRDYEIEQDDVVDFTSYYERKRNEDGGFDYSCTYMVGSKIVDKIDKLTPNRYPFAILYNYPQRQDFWGLGICEIILDNQKIINKVESIIAMIGTLMQNPQKVVSRESGINPVNVAKYGSAPGQVWTANGPVTNAISYVQPPQIPMPLFSMLENAKTNIREITGLTEAYMGQTVGSMQTSSGVQSLIDRSTLRDRDEMYDVELFIEAYSRLILDFMVSYYEDERQIRIMGENPDEYTFESFIGTEFADLEYDIAIDVSSKAPITRMREKQEAQELLNMQGQYGAAYPVPIIKPQEAIAMMHMAKGDEIIQRMNMEEMQNKTEQAMQVAQMISEAQQQGIPPEEIQNMAMAMFEQIENGGGAGAGGMGSTAQPNENSFQQAQGSPLG